MGDDRFPVWSRFITEAQGMVLPDHILSGEPYLLRAFIGIGPNVMMWPHSRRMVRALEALDLVVVTDLFHTPTTRLADYVLPASSFLEREALFLEGEEARLKLPAIAPLGDSKPDWWIIFELAKRLGLSTNCWNGSLRDGIREMLMGTGVSYEELRRVSTVDLSPHKDVETGTPHLGTPTGKVEAWSTVLEEYGFDALPVYPLAASQHRTPPAAHARPARLYQPSRCRTAGHLQWRPRGH